MTDRACRVCAASLAGRRSDAVVCSTVCASKLLAERKKRARRGEDARACPVCGESMDHLRADATACSRRCRERARADEINARRRASYGPADAKRLREWRRANRAQYRATTKAQRATASAQESSRVYMATWRQLNANAIAAYEAANPEQRAARWQRRRAAQAAAGLFLVTARDLRRQFARQGGRCAVCSEVPEQVEWDHIVPIVRGGRHSIGNLHGLCRPCNRWKGVRFLIELRLRGRVPRPATLEVRDARSCPEVVLRPSA